MEKYCKSCLNAQTPLCKECTYIEHSKGVSDPSMYCGYDTTITEEVSMREIAAIIEFRANNNLPIPLRYVIKYNKILEDRYGKTENISAL